MLLKHRLLFLGNTVGAILIFLGKGVEFVDEHAWALIVLVARLLGI